MTSGLRNVATRVNIQCSWQTEAAMAFQVGQVWTATFHEALRWATVIKIEKDGSLGLFCMDNLLYEEWVAWDQVAPSGPWELYTGRRPALPVEELVSRILRRAALSGACPPDVSAKIIPTLSGWFVQSIPPPWTGSVHRLRLGHFPRGHDPRTHVQRRAGAVTAG
jgi:hypothetical protein